MGNRDKYCFDICERATRDRPDDHWSPIISHWLHQLATLWHQSCHGGGAGSTCSHRSCSVFQSCIKFFSLPNKNKLNDPFCLYGTFPDTSDNKLLYVQLSSSILNASKPPCFTHWSALLCCFVEVIMNLILMWTCLLQLLHIKNLPPSNKKPDGFYWEAASQSFDESDKTFMCAGVMFGIRKRWCLRGTGVNFKSNDMKQKGVSTGLWVLEFKPISVKTIINDHPQHEVHSPLLVLLWIL